MSRNTQTAEYLAYCLQQARGIRPATLTKILRRLARERCSPQEFLGLPPASALERFEVPPEVIDKVIQPAQTTLDNWRRLQDRGVKVLVIGSPEYPQRLEANLGPKAPGILYTLGNASLFGRPSIGFCGSRKASSAGLQLTSDCASLLAQRGFNVVSGNAQGVDRAAHEGALSAGGTTTRVLAEGMLHVPSKGTADMGTVSSRELIVSEFPPSLPWAVGSAMTRNRTICGLVGAVVLIEPGLEGGTFAAGKTALSLRLPVFCAESGDNRYDTLGTIHFLKNGATPLRRKESEQPDLAQIMEAAIEPSPNASAEQADLLFALAEERPNLPPPSLARDNER